MWACALGHTEAALVLYQWDPRALSIPDSLGRLPLNIARSRGHTRLAELLEQLQQTPQAQGQTADTWMDRWRGESRTSGISDSPTLNPNSGGKALFCGLSPTVKNLSNVKGSAHNRNFGYLFCMHKWGICGFPVIELTLD